MKRFARRTGETLRADERITTARSYWAGWSTGVTWTDVNVGDFDGDGKSDLVGRNKEAGQWYVGKSTGAAFANQLWATWSSGVTWTDIAAANLAN